MQMFQADHKLSIKVTREFDEDDLPQAISPDADDHTKTLDARGE